VLLGRGSASAQATVGAVEAAMGLGFGRTERMRWKGATSCNLAWRGSAVVKLLVCTLHGVCKLGDHMCIRGNFLWERFWPGRLAICVPAWAHKREESELSMMSGVHVSGGPHVGGTCVWGGVDASVDLVFSGWVAGREKLNLPFFWILFSIAISPPNEDRQNF